MHGQAALEGKVRCERKNNSNAIYTYMDEHAYVCVYV